MTKQQITKAIRHLYIAKLLPAILFLIFTGFIMYKYPFQEILLPKPLSNINSIFDEYKSGQEFLEITVPNLSYTGYDYMLNSVKKGSYYYSFIDNTCVFFLLSNDTCQDSLSELNNITLKAKLIADTSNLNELREHFASDLSWTELELDKISSSFIVSEIDYFVPRAYALLLFIGVIDFYTLLSIIGYLTYILAPQFAPACKHLGNKRNAKQLLLEADLELNCNRDIKLSNICITSNYLICLNKYQVEIIPLDKIIWAYKHSTMSKFFGISYNLIIHTAYGVTKFKHMEKFEADSVLEYFSNQNPNILLGYSKANKELYKCHAKKR